MLDIEATARVCVGRQSRVWSYTWCLHRPTDALNTAVRSGRLQKPIPCSHHRSVSPLRGRRSQNLRAHDYVLTLRDNFKFEHCMSSSFQPDGLANAPVELDPYLGTNLPMYPALPLPRRLSSFDPEWEDDPEFASASRRELAEADAAKKLPSPSVLRDILKDLNDEQVREEQLFRQHQQRQQQQFTMQQNQRAMQSAIADELQEQLQLQADAGGKGATQHDRLAAKVTGISFTEVPEDGSGDKQRVVAGRRTGRWNGPAGEPDLIRATTCNGPKVGLSPVWSLSSDGPAVAPDPAAPRPQGGDKALYAAPLLQTMQNYDEDAFTDGTSRRRTMNLVKMDTEPGRQPTAEWSDASWRIAHAGHGVASAAGSQGSKPNKVITFRHRAELYQPTAKELKAKERVLIGADAAEGLRGLGTPENSTHINDTGSKTGRKSRPRSKQSLAKVQADVPRQDSAAALSFAERFASEPREVVCEASAPAAHRAETVAAELGKEANTSGGAIIAGNSTTASVERVRTVDDYNSSYRLSRPPAFRPQISLRPGSRQPDFPRRAPVQTRRRVLPSVDRFDPQEWAGRRTEPQPTLKDFYENIVTIQ
eukprot:SAG31_NODE_912_length_11066_cov_4.092186_2_plen_593_part_00